MPENLTDLPGNPRHQALLRAIAAHYAGDERVRAVALFGSLARGNWDDWSDLDLDIVVADYARLDVMAEVRALCAALEQSGEQAALIVDQGSGSADVVFASLDQFSIRYHPLAATSPNIVESLRVVAGPLDASSIVAAGQANRAAESHSALAPLVDACVRDGLYVAIALRRGRPWGAIAMLERMRERLVELFRLAHGGGRAGSRAYELLQARASPVLLTALEGTLPTAASAAAIAAALLAAFALLEAHLDELSAGTLQLSEVQRRVIAAIRAALPPRV